MKSVEDEPNLRVDGGPELNALLRTVMEAKFRPDPGDELVSWSPLVADIANRVADALDQIPRRVPRPDAGAWRRPENHPEKLAVVRARILACEAWSGWSEEQRREQVRILLAPLQPDDALIEALIALDSPAK